MIVAERVEDIRFAHLSILNYQLFKLFEMFMHDVRKLLNLQNITTHRLISCVSTSLEYTLHPKSDAKLIHVG